MNMFLKLSFVIILREDFVSVAFSFSAHSSVILALLVYR